MQLANNNQQKIMKTTLKFILMVGAVLCLPVFAQTKTITGVTLKASVCEDYCHLTYVDATGVRKSAICADKLCQSWDKKTSSFASAVGRKADLVMARQFVPEGQTTVDSITKVTMQSTEGSSPAQAAVTPSRVQTEFPDDKAVTRFGVLENKDRKELRYRKQLVTFKNVDEFDPPRLKYMASLGDADVVLLQFNAGTACPAMYKILTVVAKGVMASQTFGTCSDLPKMKGDGDRLAVTMPMFMGPGASEADHRKVRGKYATYVYQNGVIAEQK